MWGTLVGLSLFLTLHPVRLGVILLVISRSRPVQNLLAYWVGCMMVSLPAFLIPLTVVHVTPTFTSFTKNLATPGTVANSTARHIEIGIGVLALSIAALMAVRFAARRRAQLPTPGGGRHRLDTRRNTLLLNSNAPRHGRHRLPRLDNASTPVPDSDT
ncbi:MAG: GAP family protein, partial [Mycobacterium sp.]